MASLVVLPAVGAWEGTAFAVDWQPDPGTTLGDRATALLDDTDYALDLSFDALGRRTGTTAPVDATGSRARIAFSPHHWFTMTPSQARKSLPRHSAPTTLAFAPAIGSSGG